MPRAPLLFWVLCCCTVLLIGSGIWTEQTAPVTNAELSFRLKTLQSQLRMLEGRQMLALELGADTEDAFDVAHVSSSLEALALDTTVASYPHLQALETIREPAVGLWVIARLTAGAAQELPQTSVSPTAPTRETAPRMSSDAPVSRIRLSNEEWRRVDKLLDGSDSALANAIRSVASGTAISSDLLNDAETSPWLRRRLLLQSSYPNAPLSPQSRWLESERSFIQRAMAVQSIMVVVLLTGTLLLIYLLVTRPPWQRRDDSPPPWTSTWWGPMYIAMLWFLSYQVLSLLLFEGLIALDLSREYTTSLQFVIQAVSLGLALTLMRRLLHPRLGWVDLLSSLRLGLHSVPGGIPRTLFFAFGMVAVASPLVLLGGQLTELSPIRLREHVAILDVIQLSHDGDTPWLEWALLMAVTVGAPLCEETIFRGMLYRHLRTRLGVWSGVGLSALAFALVHGSLASLLPLFILGVLLAIVVEWSGGVLPAMIAHGVWNLYQLLLPMVLLAP